MRQQIIRVTTLDYHNATCLHGLCGKRAMRLLSKLVDDAFTIFFLMVMLLSCYLMYHFIIIIYDDSEMTTKKSKVQLSIFSDLFSFINFYFFFPRKSVFPDELNKTGFNSSWVQLLQSQNIELYTHLFFNSI